MDARPKNIFTAVVRACGILKQFGYYQYIVCSEIRGIPDCPDMKILQKYRVTIVVAFARFVMIIVKGYDFATGMDSFYPVIVGILLIASLG